METLSNVVTRVIRLTIPPIILEWYAGGRKNAGPTSSCAWGAAKYRAIFGGLGRHRWNQVGEAAGQRSRRAAKPPGSETHGRGRGKDSIAVSISFADSSTVPPTATFCSR